jgi:hypothetical protein
MYKIPSLASQLHASYPSHRALFLQSSHRRDLCVCFCSVLLSKTPIRRCMSVDLEIYRNRMHVCARSAEGKKMLRGPPGSWSKFQPMKLHGGKRWWASQAPRWRYKILCLPLFLYLAPSQEFAFTKISFTSFDDFCILLLLKIATERMMCAVADYPCPFCPAK